MAEWLGQSSQGHEMNCHDLEGSNHSQIELGVRSNSKLYWNNTKIKMIV